jgi:hypothetical protein
MLISGTSMWIGMPFAAARALPPCGLGEHKGVRDGTFDATKTR